MSWLGSTLDLPEGTRLTGVQLHAVEDAPDLDEAVVAWTMVQLDDSCEAEVAGPAVSRFLPSVVASVHGVLPDGTGWFACFQLVPPDVDTDALPEVVGESVLRALALTGLPDDAVWSHEPLDADELREVVGEQAEADVGHWDATSLLVALLVELTNADLEEVVAAIDALETAEALDALDPDPTGYRRSQLHGYLDRWSSTRS